MHSQFPTPIKLFLIRNGHTVGNASLKLQGQTEGKLSLKGELQAKLLKQALLEIKPTHYYSSPLKRACDTATYSIGKNKNIRILGIIKERNFGLLTNLTYFDMIKLSPKSKLGGNENLEMMRKRSQSFLKFIAETHKPNDIIVAFSHHEFILSCIYCVTKAPLVNFRNMMISNASITQLDYYNSKWVIKRVNEIGHLKGLGQTDRVY